MRRLPRRWLLICTTALVSLLGVVGTMSSLRSGASDLHAQQAQRRMAMLLGQKNATGQVDRDDAEWFARSPPPNRMPKASPAAANAPACTIGRANGYTRYKKRRRAQNWAVG
jgi:hypothetical protein